MDEKQQKMLLLKIDNNSMVTPTTAQACVHDSEYVNVSEKKIIFPHFSFLLSTTSSMGFMSISSTTLRMKGVLTLLSLEILDQSCGIYYDVVENVSLINHFCLLLFSVLFCC